MDRIQKVLQRKNPCEISVRELIEMTNDRQVKYAEVYAHKRARKNRIVCEIEKRICDILQYKHCYITKWRRPSGRPKKFYICKFFIMSLEHMFCKNILSWLCQVKIDQTTVLHVHIYILGKTCYKEVSRKIVFHCRSKLLIYRYTFDSCIS